MRIRLNAAGPRSKRKTPLVSKLFASLFSLVFMAAGLFGMYLIGKGFWENYTSRSWDKVRCKILSSTIETNELADNPYDFKVTYSYTYAERSYTGDRYTSTSAAYSDYSKAQRLADRYPVGSEVECLVNPKDPSKAFLVPGNLLIGVVMVFPGIFVLVGFFLLKTVWTSPAPRSVAKSKGLIKTGRSAQRGIGGFLLLVGAGLSYPLLIMPVSRTLEAKNWTSTDCTVIESSVKRHSGDKSSTYSVEVFYSYVVNGKEYKSNRYKFTGGSSSGYESKQKIVDNYPPGSHFTCFVNPTDPTDAVIERGLTWEIALSIIPLLFGGIGLVILNLKPGQNQAIGGRFDAGDAIRATDVDFDVAGTQELRPSASPRGMAIGATIGALLWNGIISVFIYQVWQGWSTGHGDKGLTLFMIPFALVGLLLIFGTVYFWLATANPIPILTISTAYLGKELSINWRFKGRSQVITAFSITLEGRESATYRRGTDSVTVRNTFFKKDVFSGAAGSAMAGGDVKVQIPESSMHSFTSSNNSITWFLTVKGEIPKWPDVNLDFPIMVRPVTKESI